MYSANIVESAETLFRRFYHLLPKEEKALIHQWFVEKREYEQGYGKTPQKSVEYMEVVSLLTPIVEVSENSLSVKSSYCSIPKQEQNDISNAMVIVANKRRKRQRCMSEFDMRLNDYIAEFKEHTESFSFHWLNNLSFQLLANVKPPHYKAFYNACLGTPCSSHYLNNGLPVCTVPTAVPSSTVHSESANLHQYPKRFRRCVDQNSSSPYSTPFSAQAFKYSSGNNAEAKLEYELKTEIQLLQEMRLPLIQARTNIMEYLKEEHSATSSKYKDYLKLELVIEVADLCIEMKNQLRFGHNVLNSFQIADKADSTVAACLYMSSTDELKCLFITFLKKFIDIRESSSFLDKEIMKQDDFLLYQKNIIRNLNKTIMHMQNEHENTLRSLYQRFMPGMECAAPSSKERNAVARLERKELKTRCTATVQHFPAVLDTNMQDFNLRRLQGCSATPDVKVIKQKHKLIIEKGPAR